MKKFNFLFILLILPVFFFAKKDTLTLADLNERMSVLENYKENIDKTAKIDYDNSIKEFKKDTGRYAGESNRL